MANPYVAAWRRRRRARRQQLGALRGLTRLVPVLALGLAGPLIQPVFMAFLAAPERMGRGLADLSLRVGMVLAGAMALATYTALVRGPERAILDPHPARPAELLRYLLRRTAVEQAIWPLGAAALLAPILVAGEPVAWALAVAVAAGGWAVGLLVGFPVHLGSVWAAESPSLAGVLELIRGENPKLQAALIYGPGVALLVGAFAVWGASEGARMLLEGRVEGAVLLATPIWVGGLAWLPTARLADGYHFRTTLLLAEIDAAYAGQEDPEEARRVYLEWALRLMPAALRSEALKELRHGWRGLRGWITGAWGLGALGLLSAWSEDPTAAPRTAVLAGAGLVLVGLVGLRLAVTDPEWLDQALPHRHARRLAARGVVLFGWLQGVILLPVAGLLVRQGADVALPLLGGLEGLALVLAALSAGSSHLRGRGLAPYLFLALVSWGGVAALAAEGFR